MAITEKVGPKTGPLRGPGLFGLGPLDRSDRFRLFGHFGHSHPCVCDQFQLAPVQPAPRLV